MRTNSGGATRPILVTAVLLACIPSVAHANAGTPLIWAAMLHLLFGNAVIGVAEGLLLSRILRIPAVKATGLMIAANYASAWAGYILLRSLDGDFDLTLDNVWRFYWLMVLAAYGLTLLIEWPFVALCARRTPNWLRQSVKGSLIIQTASYALLFGFYWMASEASLCTGMTRVPLSALKVPEGAVLYYIDSLDGAAKSLPLAGGAPQTIYDLRSTWIGDRLFVRSDSLRAKTWDLCVRLINKYPNEPTLVVVRPSLTTVATADYVGQLDDPKGDWMSFRQAAQLGEAANSSWTFHTGFWPADGLSGHNERTGENVRFALETPFVAWMIDHVTQLPNDLVVFQLGDDQICLADPATRRIALVARGRGPVVAIDQGTARPPTTMSAPVSR